MNNNDLILNCLYKVNLAAKTFAKMKQEAYKNKLHVLCADYKNIEMELYCLKVLTIQQLFRDGVLIKRNDLMDVNKNILSQYATTDEKYVFCSVSNKTQEGTEKLYQKKESNRKCLYYKPFANYLMKHLSKENKKIFELINESRVVWEEERAIKNLNKLQMEYGIGIEVENSAYIGDSVDLYTVVLYKDGLLLTKIYIHVNSELDDHFFRLEDTFYYGNSEWHSYVESLFEEWDEEENELVGYGITENKIFKRYSDGECIEYLFNKGGNLIN